MGRCQAKDTLDAELALKEYGYEGHVFAIVGRYLVGWCATEMACISDRCIFDLADPKDAALALRLIPTRLAIVRWETSCACNATTCS